MLTAPPFSLSLHTHTFFLILENENCCLHVTESIFALTDFYMLVVDINELQILYFKITATSLG